MELDRLITELSMVPDVTIGLGPRHPIHSNPSLASDLANLLCEHPFLRDYPDYVEFLERYGGASFNSPARDPDAFFMIYGIGEYYEEGLLDQQESYYCFCDGGINGA